jgi:hypothetical protein
VSQYAEDPEVWVHEKATIRDIQAKQGWTDAQLLSLLLGFSDDRGLTWHLAQWIEDAAKEPEDP